MGTRAKNSRGQLAYIKEVEYGKKVTSGAATKLKFTGESLKQSNEYTDSNEIRDDRQLAGAELTGISTSGNINMELRYGAEDDLLAAGLFSAGWSSPVTITSTTTAVFAAIGTITLTSASDSVASFVPGSWIKISNTASNNGYAKIAAVDVATRMITVSHKVLVDETAPGVSIIQGSQIVNGVTQTSFNLQRKYSDLTNAFVTFLGQVVKGLSLNVALKSIITTVFDFVGKCEQDDTSQIGSSYTPVSNVNPVMKTTASIKGLFSGGEKTSATDFTVALDNSCQVADELNDEIGPIGVDEGTVIVTGSLKAYFASNSLYSKYLNDANSSLAIVIADKLGNAYVIDLPSVKYTDGNRTIQNKDGSVMADMQFKATADDVENVTIRLVKFPV